MAAGVFTLCGLTLESTAKPRPTADASAAFARRVVKTFDFNEKPLGNLEDTPMNWVKVEATGFPHYVNGSLDDQAGRPKPSFKLQLDGGNLGYVFTERLIPAFPGSDHKILTWVKTKNLRHARGYLEAFYMDRFGNLLADTVAYSRLIEPAKPGDPEWRPVSVELPYTNNDGRFIGLGIFLVQQDQLPDQFASPVKSYRKDIDAALWLDEITVLRLPKARLRLLNDTAVFTTDQEVKVGATVADSKTDDLSARIILEDMALDRALAYAHPVAILPPLEAILRGQATAPGLVTTSLGTLQPGPYKIILQVLAGASVIIEKEIDIAVLNAGRSSAPTRDFGLDITTADISRPDLVGAFVGNLRPAWVILPVWRKDFSISRFNSEQSAPDRMILELNHRGISVIGSFLDVSDEMARRTKILNPNIWDLFGGDPEWWRPDLSIVLSRHADRIDRWLFGRVSDCWQTPDGRMGTVMTNLKKEFSQFQGQFDLIAAWPAMVDIPPEHAADGVLTQIPSELIPGSFPDYFSAWTGKKQDLWAVLQGQDLEQFEFQPAMTDFVHRFVAAKACRVKRLAARQLWTSTNPIAPGGCQPSPYYPAFANLVDRLDGLDFLGKIEIAPGRYGLLFGGPEHGVLVLMDTRQQPYRGLISLGDQLKPYDIWGRPVPITTDQAGWTIPYRPVVFLDGIDGELARFIASIKFDPPTIPSKFGIHQLRLLFKNTFSQGIGGMVRLQGPVFWQFDPAGSKFALPAGKEFVLPMKLRYPSNESIGRKSINLRFDLEARKPITLNLMLPLHVGVSDLEMRVLWFMRGQELVVCQEVINNGSSWTDLVAFLIAPDQPRMERQVRRLGPGQTALKEYSLGPWNKIFGKTIRVGFREVRGTRLVNEVITLE
jgi:hypothetical protein